MAALSIQVPYPVFYDRDGQPLDNGNIYIGVANLDPVTNPLQVYYDEALTITASQPLVTSGGYVYRNGTPAQLYVNATDFSITVNDSKDLFVYSFPEATGIGVGAASIEYDPPFVGAVTSGYTVAEKLSQTISVQDFGATGDGVTNDAAAINAAATALQGLGGGTLVFPIGTYYIATSTITIPKYVEVCADANAVIVQSTAATGTALIVEGRPFTDSTRRPRIHTIPSLQKGTPVGQPAWNLGTDTSSIGLHIKGCSDDTFFIRAVAYFYNGVLMNSDYAPPAPVNTLCVNNTLNLGNIRNCYKGLWLENGANSNTFIQGVINVDGAWITAGTTHITLKGSESNTNTFVGTNIEGNLTAGLKGVDVESGVNLFSNCRIEKLPAGALQFGPVSNSNMWIGGSDKASSVSNGYYDAVVSDSGFGNVFQWAGIYGGKFVALDNGSGTDRQGIGFSTGVAAPTAWFTAYRPTTIYAKGTAASPLTGIRYEGQLHQEKVEITTGTVWNADANYVIANYATPTTVSRWLSESSASDVSANGSVMSVNGNVTIQHTASPVSGASRFVLTAGVNLLLTAFQPVSFMSYDGNWYQI
jgi:hypothetical protein